MVMAAFHFHLPTIIEERMPGGTKHTCRVVRMCKWAGSEAGFDEDCPAVIIRLPGRDVNCRKPAGKLSTQQSDQLAEHLKRRCKQLL